MKTYNDDNYDDVCKSIMVDRSEFYKDFEYCKWLEDLAIKLITKDKYIGILDLEKKIKRLHIGLDYSEVLHMRIEDKEIRKNNPLLANYPLCLFDPDPQEDEEIEKVNEWEIRIVAQLAQEILDETHYQVRPDDYKRFLKKLEPYKYCFLDQTWYRLSEEIISQYLSVRLDRNIPWSETNDHLDNIVYDLNKLVYVDRKEERFLDIKNDIQKGIFHFWRYEDL